MTQSIYIAGSSVEVSRAIHWAKQLRISGHVVTSGWADAVELAGGGNKPGTTTAERQRLALNCVEQLDMAQRLWILMPPRPLTSMGAFWEFGYAYRACKPVMISGPGQDASVFTDLCQELIVKYDHDELAFKAIIDMDK